MSLMSSSLQAHMNINCSMSIGDITFLSRDCYIEGTVVACLEIVTVISSLLWVIMLNDFNM